jgi:putrescine aminotransferase
MSAVGRAEALATTSRHLAPHRLEMFRRFGVELVMGERSGYRFRNLDSDWIYDLHLNGGTFNLGHRNDELRQSLVAALDEFDVGNHHFASTMRAKLSEELLATQSFGAEFVVFSSSGSEAVDVAIKAARWATKRRPVISIDQGYHGRSGLSGAVGDDSAARYFFSDYPAECIKVGWNDGAAIEQAIITHQPCAVIIETVPATYGFPPPAPGFLAHVRDVCTRHDVLLIADEVQTGLGRSGSMWAIENFGVRPDLLITSKGLGGGLYPFAATLMTERTGQWLRENGWGFVSTFGGSEVGCAVASKVLDITQRDETTANVRNVIQAMADGLTAIQKANDYLLEIRQTGLIIGLKFDHPEGALHVMKALLDRGVWAIFAGFDLSVLQFKPGLLLTTAECNDIIDRTEQAFRAAARQRSLAPGGFGLPRE